jgi:hypothetical protein
MEKIKNKIDNKNKTTREIRKREWLNNCGSPEEQMTS